MKVTGRLADLIAVMGRRMVAAASRVVAAGRAEGRDGLAVKPVAKVGIQRQSRRGAMWSETEPQRRAKESQADR